MGFKEFDTVGAVFQSFVLSAKREPIEHFSPTNLPAP
jgi:hypothetical protein